MKYTEYTEAMKMRELAKKMLPIGRMYFNTYKHVRVDKNTIELHRNED